MDSLDSTFPVQKLHGIFSLGIRGVSQAGIVPPEIMILGRICGHHDIRGVGGNVEKGKLENPVPMISVHILGHGIMDGLVFLMFQIQGDNGVNNQKL